MFHDQKDVIYYITVENENYIHPPLPEGVEEDILKGLYKIHSTQNPKIRLLGSGPLMGEIIAASKLLKEDWGIEPGIWNVTSFSELRKDAEEVDRWNLVHPDEDQRKSHIEKSLSKNRVPTVVASDYVKMLAEQIAPYVPGPYYALGTDGFGRSDTRENLRRFFEVDRYYIVLTAIKALVADKELEKTAIKKAIDKYSLDPEKPNPRNM